MKRILAALALTLVLAAGLVPGLALAADDGASPSVSMAGLTTQAAAFTHEGFEVTSPQKGATYDLSEAIDIKIQTLKFIPKYVNGFIDSQINYIFFEIWKDDTCKMSEEFWYGATSDWRWYCVGSEISRTYTPTEVGTYTVKIGYSNARNSDFTESNLVGTYTFNVVKKMANPMTAKGKKVTFKASKLKAKARSVKASKAFKVKNAKGNVTYKVTQGITKNALKKVKVAANGKVTVKKGAKKGTYKLKVEVTAAGDSSYKAKSKVVTLTVKVK